MDVLEDRMEKHAAGGDRKFQLVFEVLGKLMAEDDASGLPSPIGSQVQDGE
jgi:hypothetical protein